MRIQCQGLLVSSNGLLPLFQFGQHVAQVVPGFGKLDVQLDGLTKTLDGLLLAAQPVQDLPS